MPMRPHLVGLLAFALVSGGSSAREARAQANVMGSWSPLFFTGEQATDCGVLRGNGDSTVVLFYDNTQQARLLLYNPANPIGSPIVRVPYATHGLHEGAHTVLGDGRYIVFGGSVPGRFNSGFTATFDPKRYADPVTRGWAADDEMFSSRIASNAVIMPDGSVLVQSGIDHFSLPMFGGEAGSGLTQELRELAVRSTPTERWSQRPNPNPPPAREGSRADFAFSHLTMFGGRGAAGALSDVWLAQRRQATSGIRWQWDAMLLTFTSPVPPARSDHGLVVHRSSCDSICDTLWVFGGKGSGGQALGDVWRLIQGNRSQNRFRWESVTPANPGPGPRHGHSAVYDPGPPGGAAAGFPRMLVFGGRDSLGALCDNRVWSMTLRAPYRWNELTPATSTPAPRTGAMVQMDHRGRNPATKPRRMTVFGGEGASGTLSDTWFLFRGNTSAADTTYAWTINTASPGAPPARTRGAFIYDESSDRFLLWGGDADAGDATSGLLQDLWMLGPPLDPAYPAVWTALGQDSMPSAKAGSTLTYWPRGSATVLTPERYDPSAPPGSRFTRLDWANLYDQWLYPYMMLTAQGRVLYAAITDSSKFLDPDPNSPTRGWGQAVSSYFSGASGAALRPDLFMKSGGDQQPTLTGLLKLDSLGNTTGWEPVLGMMPRIDHSTLVLPDGRVLVTGGDAQRKNTALAQRQPQIFDPETRAWSGPLATAPAIRGYHSTAVLMPDARVLSWGGFINNTPRDSAEVYSPPYLFSDGSGTLAPRPEITSMQDTISYDQPFLLCACQAPAIRSMSLIRPGSPTHAFDQNARFVPLTFERDASGTWFTVRSPKNANWAPPGDYMLFAVDSSGVPSMARWVHVRPGDPVASAGCTAPCVTSVGTGPALAFALHPPRPNPGVGSTLLSFALPAAAQVTLEVLDLQGRRIRRIADGRFEAGTHALRWDGRASDGERSRAGIYFVRLRHEDGRLAVARLVRLP